MSVDGKVDRGRTLPFVLFAAEVTRKRSFLHAAMNACLLESLKGGGLCVGQPRLGAALGEGPAATTSLNQQELDATAANPVTNRSHLFTSTQPTKV